MTVHRKHAILPNRLPNEEHARRPVELPFVGGAEANRLAHANPLEISRIHVERQVQLARVYDLEKHVRGRDVETDPYAAALDVSADRRVQLCNRRDAAAVHGAQRDARLSYFLLETRHSSLDDGILRGHLLECLRRVDVLAAQQFLSRIVLLEEHPPPLCLEIVLLELSEFGTLEGCQQLPFTYSCAGQQT